MKTNELILAAIGGVIAVLLGGNAYFISRMVDKVDKIEETTWGLKQEVLVLKLTVEARRQK